MKIVKGGEVVTIVMANEPPLIAHLVFRLDVGGLENGIINLLNGIPRTRYRQTVVCLSTYTDFRFRAHDRAVPVYALDKRAGKDISVYSKAWRLLRKLKPAIVHTRNIGTLDMIFPAFLARVPHRIHGEHGRDMVEITGQLAKYQSLRRMAAPLVERFVCVSHDLAQWMSDTVGIEANKIIQICNGVDTKKFVPTDTERPRPLEADFFRGDVCVIGSIGRLSTIKNHTALVDAIKVLSVRDPSARKKLRLVIVGEGRMRDVIEQRLTEANLWDITWMPGSRDDIPTILQALDIFVLPSLNEGISNTILEAMATGLPVIATAVGGNSELVQNGRTGQLVPPNSPEALADAIRSYLKSPALRREHGRAGRQRAVSSFGLDVMLQGYLQLYDELLGLST